MTDGKIRGTDLLESKAANVYTELKGKAVDAIEAIAIALEDLNKKQKQYGLSVKDVVKVENARNIKLTELGKIKKQLAIVEEKLIAVNSKENKLLQEATQKINKKNKALRESTKVTKTHTKAIQQTSSAYEQLKTKTEIATKKAKEMATVYGVTSKKAKRAAETAAIFERELKLVNNTTKTNIKLNQQTSSELQKLNTKLSIAKSKHSELAISLGKENVKTKEAAIAVNNLKNKIKTATTTEEKAISVKKRNTKAIHQTSDAYQKLVTKTRIAEQRAKVLATQFGVESKQAKKAALSARKLNIQLKQINSSTKRASSSTRNLNTQIRKIKKSSKSASTGISKLGISVRQAFSRFIGFTIISTAIFAIASAIRKTVEQIAEFDKSMTDLSAILKVNRRELKGLNAEILNVAANSVNTSNDVAKLAVALATLGKTKDEIRLLLKPVNDLAIGLGSTSEEAGNLLVNTLNAFGEGADAAGKYANIIANMRISTSLDFQKIVDSLGFVTPVAKTVGDSLENVGARLGVLVSSGQKAAKAGRLLRTSYLRLAKQGLSVEDALDKINIAQNKGIKGTKLLTVAGKLFGTNAAAIGIILANNRDRTAELTKKFIEQGGILDDLVNDKLKSISAQIKITNSLWERWMLSIENGTGRTSTFFKDTLLFMDEAIRRLQELTTSSEDSFNFKKFNEETQGLKDGIQLVNDELKKYKEEGFKITKQQVVESNIESYGIKYEKLKGRIGQAKNELIVFGKIMPIIKRAGISLHVSNQQEIDDRNKLRDGLKKEIKQKELEFARVKGLTKAFMLLNEEKSSIKNTTNNAIVKEANLRKFLSLKHKIEAQDLLNDIKRNKLRIKSSKTLYTEKIRLIEENRDALLKINKLLAIDEIQKIKNVAKEGNIKNQKKFTDAKINFKEFSINQIRINKNKDDKIVLSSIKRDGELIDLETNTAKQIEAIIKKETSDRQQSMNKRLAIIDQILQKELRANTEALRDGQITRRQKIDLDRDALDAANKEALGIVNSTFDNIKKILLDAGFPIEQIILIIDKLKEKYKELGDSAKKGLSKQDFIDILSFASEAIGKIGEMTRNASQARIDSIEAEITAEEEKYAKLKELAGDNKSTQIALDMELASRKASLKDKERKEKIKQWKIDKEVSLTQTAMNTAAAVMKAAGTGFWAIAPIIALGALEEALILSTKMPKFEKGGVMTYDGSALINEKTQEYVQRGSNILKSKGKNTIVDLQKGDIIHKDLDALLNANIMQSISNEHNIDMSLLGSIMKQNYSGLSNEIKKGFSGVKNQVNIRTQKIDIPQALYKQSQVEW